MRGISTSKEIITKIHSLRSRGCSISEIAVHTGKSKSIVSKYIHNVAVHPRYTHILKAKQGGSRARSLSAWENARKRSEKSLSSLSKKERLLVLTALYWGEGTKSELNVINSDPSLLRVVVSCLKELGISDSQIKATIRIYGDLDRHQAVLFWSKSLHLPVECFKNVNVLQGKKSGKLPYGMCRIRVEKSSQYFKFIMSLIERIKILLP